jgi:hypothetical protein
MQQGPEMGTRVTKSNGTTVTIETTIETTIDVSGPMLRAEEAILSAANEVGAAATVEALKRFDAEGEPATRQATQREVLPAPVR